MLSLHSQGPLELKHQDLVKSNPDDNIYSFFSDEIERQSAAAILEDFKLNIQKEFHNGELSVEVKGLEIMNDDKVTF